MQHTDQVSMPGSAKEEGGPTSDSDKDMCPSGTLAGASLAGAPPGDFQRRINKRTCSETKTECKTGFGERSGKKGSGQGRSGIVKGREMEKGNRKGKWDGSVLSAC